MAGQARCLCVLWILTGLLLLLSLPIPSTEFELHDQDWEGLRSDLVTLHRLEGSAERTTYGKAGRERLSESMPVAYARTGFLSSEGFENKFHKEPMTLVHGLEGCEDFAKCVSESEQDFDAFLREIERQKAKDVLLTASEVSRSPRLRLLLLLDQAWETQHRATEDYRLDPHQSVEVSPACLVNDSCLPVGANRNTVVKIFGTVDSHGQSVSGYTGPSLAHLMMKPAFRNAGLFSLGNGTSFTFRSSFLRAFGELHSGSTVVEMEEHNTNIYQTLDNAGELVQFHVPKPRPDTSTRYDRQHILLLEDEAIVREAGTLLFEKHPAVSSLYVLENGGWPKLVKGNLGPLTEESRLVLVGHGRKMDGAGKISLGMFGAKDVAEIVSRMSQEGKRIKTTSVVACKVGADEAFRGTLLRELRARSVETELHTRTSLLQVSHSGQKVSVEVTPEGLQYRHRDPSKKVVDTLGSDGRMVSRVEPGDMGEAVYHDQRNFLGKTGMTPKVRDEWKLDRIDFGDNPQGKLQKYTLQWFDAKADERAPTPTAESDTTSYWMDNTNNVDKILKTCRKINTVKELVNEIHHQAKYGDRTDIYYNLHDWIYKVNPKTLYVYLVGRKINIDSIKKIVKQVDQNDYEKINWASVNPDSSIKDVKETIRREVKQTNFETIEERLNDYMKQIKNVIDGHRNKHTYSDMYTNIDRQDFQDKTRLKNTLETLERLYTNLQGKQDIKREIRNCAFSDGKYLIEGLSKDSSDISSDEKIREFLKKPKTEIKTIIQHKINLYKELRVNIENRISIDINAFTSSIDKKDHKIIATQLNREDYVSFTKETLQGKYKTGTHSLEKESWLADYFMASIFSESVRNFRTFPAVLMCLQGYENNKYKQKFLNYLFENHPMARGGTWVSPNRRGFHGASSVEYSSKLKNFNFKKTEEELQNDLNMVFSRESAICETWKKSNLIDLNNYFNSILPASGSRGSTGILGGSDDGAVTLQDLHSESGVELSLELSAYHARSQALLTQQIQERLQQDFGKTAGDYRLEPGSVQQEDGQFRCRLSSLKEPTKSLDWHLDLNPEGLRYTEKILEKCHEVNSMEHAEGEGISAAASPHQALKHVEHAGKAVAVVGVMLGLQGAMRAFEEGDIEHGTVAVLQTSHGVAGMILGMIAKRAKVLTSKPAQVMVRTALKKAFIVMPLVGIAFGIYNIEEDFKRKDILGYIDAGLDITMLGLDVVELLVPEVAPFLAPLNLALSVLRMVVDYVYMGIQAELDKLPEDADFLDKLDAVLCGVTMGIEHLMLDVLSFFYTIPYREIEEGQTLVEKISDYRKYYTFQKEEGGRKAIDFNGGEYSWNGGNITFCLSDDGLSKFCMDSFVSSESRFGKQCWELETDKTTQDIILGIGESHHLQYRSVQLKVFMFIPANTMEVISGYEAESHTRFGKYYGNQAANNFFTVQNPDDKKTWEVMLSYYYQLYGENGDDTFFLGPQKSYVEGRAGRDTYIIPETGGNVIINNYHPEKTIDVLMLKVNYSQISVSKSGPDVILSYLSSHHVRIQNWFTGEAYRHLQMISSDGVLFDIPTLVVSSPRLVAQGVNKMSEKRGQEVDVTQPLLQTVTDIFGSSYNDRLIGNDQNNLIDGGGGRDYVKGGEGEDIYVVKNRPGTHVQIENFSVDKKTDLLLMESRLHDLRARVSGNDLVLFSVRHSDSITLLNWFRSENNQHLLIVTEDFVTLTLANNTDSCRVTEDHFQAECLLSQSIDYSKASGPQSIDMEQDEVLQRVKEVRGSDFDDKIWGNARDNGLTPGRGSDVLAGRNGADWYMVTPAQGLKTISNYASDLVTDMLFIKERYGNIEAKCEGRDLVLYVNGSKDVVLERWFEGRPFQHLQVQTADGFRFALAENSSACLGFVKIPLSIDFRERSSNGEIMKMDEDEFASVVEMHGSRGFDVMIGNGQDNVLDPDAGGARMAGGGGVDTYVVKPGYGTRIEIDNFAEDGATDTVELAADFLGSHFAVRAESHDLLLTGAVTGGGPEITIRLLHYSVSPRYQHISFRTADRFLFRVSYPTLSNGSLSHMVPEIMVYKADLRGLKGDQYLDLSSDDRLSATSTVYGSPSHSNHLKGNGRENALFGGAADDALDGDSGDDTLVGAGGNDILLGGTGDDTLYGGEGDDYLMGGLGRDMLIPGPGRDMVDGGPGRDTVLYQGDHERGVGVYVNLLSGEGWGADAEGDFLRDVENVIGSIYADVLVSGREPTLLKGSAGNDILVSSGGEQGGGDYLMGGDGSDVYLLDDLHGFVNIDNCAEDNATDIIYVRSLSVQSVACSSFPDTIFLTIHGPPNHLVKVALHAWNSDLGCQHLEVLFSEGPVSVDTLLEMCEARWKAKLHIALGLYLLFASSSLACALYLVCRAERRARGCGRKREEKGQGGRKQQEREEGGDCDNGATTAVEEAQP